MIPPLKFIRLMRRHTQEAKLRWGALDTHGAGSGWSAPEIGISVLLEEVGKAARCVNKIGIVSDPDIAAQWRRELAHRLITSASVSMRIAEQFADVPTHTTYGGLDTEPAEA